MPKDSPENQSDEQPWPCPKCGYDLQALLGEAKKIRTRCPECGLISSSWLIKRRREMAAPVGVW
ncbi:MAG: hypothetical protein O7G85_00295 [Planctomycetota bacterium]|nr:hypothetical protein [Planctomycetota bacterium]